MNTINNHIDLQYLLSNPKEIFLDNKQDIAKIYLAYPNERDETIGQAITALNNMIVNSKANHILLNKNLRTDNEKLHIHLKIGENDAIYLGTVPCKENKYNEFLIYKDEIVTLSAFFYFIKIENDTPTELTAENKELFELMGIDWKQDYDCKKINFKGMFTVKSEDDCQNPATFIP